MDIEGTITKYLKDKLLYKKEIKDIQPNESLLDSGLIDSVGIFELVSFLEEHFDVLIEDEEVIPENFDNINSIVAFIKRKRDSTYSS